MMLRLVGMLWLCWLVMVSPAQAHDMPHSVVAIHILEDRWLLHLSLPNDRLEVAFNQAHLPVPVQATALRAYLYQHIAVTSAGASNKPWASRVLTLTAPQSDTTDWQADVELTPQQGPVPEQAWLLYSVIVNEIATHSAVVFINQDWSRGIMPDQPVLLGALRGETRAMPITRQSGTAIHAYYSMFKLGFLHIVQGSDHLVFLLLLVIAAPLHQIKQQWFAVAKPRAAWRSAVLYISMFTLGHLSTLLATSLGVIHANSAWVEILIALSILLTALHLLYPVFRRQEVMITLLFGMIHGLGFASALSELKLSTWPLLAAVFSFNIGIELVQLLMVLCLLPIFIYTRFYYQTLKPRMLLMMPVLVTASCWMFERVAVLNG